MPQQSELKKPIPIPLRKDVAIFEQGLPALLAQGSVHTEARLVSDSDIKWLVYWKSHDTDALKVLANRNLEVRMCSAHELRVLFASLYPNRNQFSVPLSPAEDPILPGGLYK